MKKKKVNRTTPLLTDKQAAFAFEYISNGRCASDAYRKIYNLKENTKPETLWNNAHKVLHNTKVMARVGQLQQQQYSGDIMSLNERKLMLTDLARLGDIKSIDMLNKMESVYVEKKEINHSGGISLESEILNGLDTNS